MTRVALACALMAAMIGLSFWGLHVLDSYRDELTFDIEALMDVAESGDDEKTTSGAKALTEKWIELHHVLCRYVRHAQLDQITLAMARLEPLARHGETGELTAELMRCKVLLEDIWDSEQPYLRNIV